jgi:hypothetical protein
MTACVFAGWLWAVNVQANPTQASNRDVMKILFMSFSHHKI